MLSVCVIFIRDRSEVIVEDRSVLWTSLLDDTRLVLNSCDLILLKDKCGRGLVRLLTRVGLKLLLPSVDLICFAK